MGRNNYSVKTVLVSIFLLLISSFSYGQIAIGGNGIPNPNTDLTLGSNNKGALLNRVKLESLTSTNPLDSSTILVGMLVYNTNVTADLVEGYYFWTSENRWRRLYVKTMPTRDMIYVGRVQTKTKYKVPQDATKTIAISDLNFDYTADRSGDLFLDMTFYSYMENNSSKAGNTFCVTTVTDNLNTKVFEGVTAMSPYIVLSNTGEIPTQGFTSFVFPVEKGKSYKIRTVALENYATTFQIVVGDYTVGSTTVHSNMKITFLSEPKL